MKKVFHQLVITVCYLCLAFLGVAGTAAQAMSRPTPPASHDVEAIREQVRERNLTDAGCGE